MTQKRLKTCHRLSLGQRMIIVMLDLQLFKEILSMDSTSGKERGLAEWLLQRLDAPRKESMEVGDGTLNLLLSWGTPRVVFCTHLDTVPPYIAPEFPAGISLAGTSLRDPSHEWAPPSYTAEGGHSSDKGNPCRERITGRGACDAKGQLLALYTACKELEAEGCTDFGLLLVSGEETGSWGAKAFAKTGFRAPYLIIGEPTENKMVSACKGTLSYELTFRGEAFHSGYPQYGVSAVNLFVDFCNRLKATDFGTDPELGETTWNVGLLHSDNPQNILSPELSCRIYFRTTFLSHQRVQDWMEALSDGSSKDAAALQGGRPEAAGDNRGQRPLEESNSVQARRVGIGDQPARYLTLPGLPAAPASFGSDAPHLTNFTHKAICGPGSIRHAHRPDEQITLQELETAVAQYVQMFHLLTRDIGPVELNG